MAEFLYVYFLETGLGWAVIGAMLAVMFGGMGSAQGIRISAAQGAGVMSEKPELFGKLLVLIALPGTQGFYGFVCAFLIAGAVGLGGANGIVYISPVQGLGLLAVGFCAGMVLWRSAVYQGETSAACISLTAKKPEESGRAIILPALVETYAVVALLAAILVIGWICPAMDQPLRFIEPEIETITRQKAMEIEKGETTQPATGVTGGATD
ncbi:MAG TPA: V-type ATP synthase subunit K [Planctomycetota bacterium]|nr:V-type ATP synthase subunit K [Planctomycetota bacterium]